MKIKLYVIGQILCIALGAYLSTIGWEGALLAGSCVFLLNRIDSQIQADNLLDGIELPPEDDVCLINTKGSVYLSEQDRGVIDVVDIGRHSFIIIYTLPVELAEYSITSTSGSPPKIKNQKHDPDRVTIELDVPIMESGPDNILVTRKHLSKQ